MIVQQNTNGDENIIFDKKNVSSSANAKTKTTFASLTPSTPFTKPPPMQWFKTYLLPALEAPTNATILPGATWKNVAVWQAVRSCSGYVPNATKSTVPVDGGGCACRRSLNKTEAKSFTVRISAWTRGCIWASTAATRMARNPIVSCEWLVRENC